MGHLEKHIEKKIDNYSIGSRQKLKAAMRHKVKRTFVGALDAIEKELGVPASKENEELFKKLRSKILSIGNDQIRNMEVELERYNIEFIPYHVKFIPLDKIEEAQGD